MKKISKFKFPYGELQAARESGRFLRCKITNIRANTIPKECNATLFAASDLCGIVLLDGTEKVEHYNWSWITFPKDREFV